MSPYESHIQMFSLRDTKSFSFIFQLSLIFRLFDFFFDFYQRPQRPRWPPLNGPLCLTYSLFVLELLTVCRLASWPSVAWPPDRLSPGLLTVCRLAYWPSVAWPPDRLSPGLLTVCRLASWPSAPASWAGPPSPVNLHLQYFFIPMFLLWRFYLFKSVLWNWLKVLWYRFMCLLLLDKCFFAILHLWNFFKMFIASV